MTNIDLFNVFAGKVLADLYERFPVPASINARGMAMSLLGADRSLEVDRESVALHLIDLQHADPDTVPKRPTRELEHYATIGHYTVLWLVNCDYVRVVGTRPPEEQIPDRALLVLSPKSLEVLSAVPTSLTAQRSYGAELIEKSRELPFEAARTAIAELVGKVIGAAIGLASQ
jgi:hypothetical protein